MTLSVTIEDELDVNESLSPELSGAEDELPGAAKETVTPEDGLPELNERETINLFAQSPENLFLYWSHAGDPFAALQKAFGDAASQYQLAVRLFDVEEDLSCTFEATPEHKLWLDALPGRDYRADVGFHAAGLPFITLLSSAVVRTPRAGISPNTDSAPPFHLTATEFAQVMEQTGYPACAVEEMTHQERPAAPSSNFCHSDINADSSGRWSVVGSR